MSDPRKALHYKAFFLFLRIRNKTELKSSITVGNKPSSNHQVHSQGGNI